MQSYHSNATTNIHIRCEIRKSNLPTEQLAAKYNVSENTILKWKTREDLGDRSFRPHTIYYSLSVMEQQIIPDLSKLGQQK